MKKCLLLLFGANMFLLGTLFAQTDINANTYTFSRSGFAPAAITPTVLIGANSDNIASAVTDIGFTFWFAGTAYTQFSVSENGIMTLGSTPISGTDFINSLASGTTLPKIAPYWDDLATGTNGSVGYQLTGVAPGRILIINWNVTVPKNVGGTANSLIQVQLSETSGNITFTYGTPAIPANAGQYSVGIGKATNDFASVTTTTTTAATVAYGTANNSNTLSIGAYSRFNFITDRTAPTISAQTIPNTFGTANRILVKTISDLKTGVPTSGSLVPRIYYKKGLAGSYVSTAGVWTTPTTWTFTVDHALLGGVSGGDQIYYYVVAQDQATTVGVPNIASLPTGVMATDVNTVTTHPTTPSFYIIGASLSGIKTVGTGGDYPSLTLAGGLFDQINSGQLSGNLTVNIISDLPSETGLNALNAWTNGAGGPFTVTINPVGNRTITTSDIAVKMNGTNGLTIDGLNDGTNSLTIFKNGGYNGAIELINGASNNTITKTSITGTCSLASGYFIMINNSTASPISNNTISYCSLSSSNTANPVYQGILLTWYSSTATGTVIDHNTFTNFGYYPIHKDYNAKFINTTISNNEIYNTAAVSHRNYTNGIFLEGACGNTNIFNNKIHDLLLSFNTLSGSGVSAINCGGVAADVLNIYNNVIYLDATFTHTLQTWYGINISNAGTSNVYYNSIYIGGTGVTAGSSYGIIKSAVGNANIMNNVVFNARTGVGTHGAFSLAGTYTANNNFSGDPGFTSPTNLQPDITNPNSGNLENQGVPIATIGTDILGNSRSTSLPTPTDIGAYEFTIPVKTLNLNLFLEGLYAGTGTMNQAFDANGPHWPAGIADHITVELRDATAYSTIVHTINNVPLSTTGAVSIKLPTTYNGNYFITIKHRNSVETTTPTAKSFAGSVIMHDFTTSNTMAYGNNLKNLSGVFAIYGGDVNQDGSVDTLDMIPVDNDSFNYVFGYLNSDVNGDGSVDTIDMITVDNNSANYIGTMHP